MVKSNNSKQIIHKVYYSINYSRCTCQWGQLQQHRKCNQHAPGEGIYTNTYSVLERYMKGALPATLTGH